ncbi:MAG: selenocysteine-specific translation elongation factor [Candidatus Eisenbacteria bacterium]|nr:selenocysteine-specific translation elongation factor [Candidatus Eisenbacteria bacterium]
MPERFAVIGTAGHIDHGKTALVRRLTGVDTDRLKEEKQRGISIDLGFAPLELPGGLRAGVVDVPGHERFIHNMLAGVGGIDLVLLVVAADEGVMPQTREHLAILDLLHIPRCVAVLSKCDLVDPAMLPLVEDELREVLGATRFAAAPVARFSARTGEGAEALKASVAAALGGLPLRSDTGAVRLPVDRVFTLEGFGTVVTGTLWRGRVRVGDTLTLQPSGRSVRVRTVESHDRRVEAIGAGSRVALSLHPLARDEARRGDWLVSPGSAEPRRRVSVRLELLRAAPRPLGQRTRVTFHLGSSDSPGVLRLLGVPGLEPGGTALAQLELRRPAVAERGDRFVVRAASPAATLGGGTVIETGVQRHRVHDAAGLERLGRLERGTAADRLAEALESSAGPMTPAQLERAAECAPSETPQALAELVTAGRAARVGGAYVSARRFEEARALLMSEVESLRREFPLRFGVGKGELKSRLQRSVPAALFDSLLARAVADGVLHAREDRVSATAEVALPADAARAAAAMLEAAREAGLQARPPAELAALGGPQGAEVLARLLFERSLVKLGPDLVFDPAALVAASALVRERLHTAPRLAVSDFKDLFGLSRKYLVPLLEHLDAVGVTRREGDVRVAGGPGKG